MIEFWADQEALLFNISLWFSLNIKLRIKNHFFSLFYSSDYAWQYFVE